ncbi:lantibiotic dehydratase [Gemmatimonas aurantiaca]|uniref:lantibiotic dehydratase n=1 Tax=Gemmatimonas aurantiaca TaxID=173480 RepID=UPI00301CDECD
MILERASQRPQYTARSSGSEETSVAHTEFHSSLPLIDPLVFARVAALPVSAVHSASGTTARRQHALLQAERALAADIPRVSDILFEAVPQTKDRDHRRHLLSLRRRIFQLDGSFTDSELRALDVGLSGEKREEVRRFVAQLDALTTCRGGLDEQYANDRIVAQRELERAIRATSFQKGLASSSDSLFRLLSRDGRPDRRMSATRSAQRARGLLRYLSRASMKATPFATFCQLLGVVIDDAEEPLRLVGSLATVPSIVRVNKSALRSLRAVLFPLPSVRECLHVALNDTIEVDGNYLRVFALSGHREAFVRLRRTPALQCVLTALERCTRVRVRNLIEAVLHDAEVDATREECVHYIDGLLNCGLLRLVSPVDDQIADWEPLLNAFLRDIRDAPREVTNARQLLDALATQISVFSGASAWGRHAMQQRSLRLMHRYLHDAGATRAVRKSLMFHEDCGAAAHIVIDRRSLAGALDDLRRYVADSAPLAYTRMEAAVAREIFEHANPGVARVPLLAFAEQYSRHRMEHNGGKKSEIPTKAGESPPTVLQTLRQARDTLTGALASAWFLAPPTADEIEVTSGMLRYAAQDAPPAGPGPRSVSVFCNLIPPCGDRGWRVVVNQGRYLSGYGKYISRFLPVLPHHQWTAVRERNASSPWGRIVEIADDGDFNPNLHPRLTDSIIQYPTGSHHGRSDAIALTDLEVGPDAADPARLALTRRSTGERIWPVDLGFLSPRLRPPLFRLLRTLGPDAQFALSLPWSLPDANGSVGLDRLDTIVVRPRYTFGEHLILARRAWHVPSVCFPRLKSNESPARYFARVQRWRFEADIPESVYVRIFSIAPKPEAASLDSGEEERGEEAGMDAAEMELDDTQTPTTRKTSQATTHESAVPRAPQISADAQKPQFIDFTNPLFVDLFSRLPGGLDTFTASLEEVLPEAGDYPRHGEDTYCTEFMAQLDLDS